MDDRTKKFFINIYVFSPCDTSENVNNVSFVRNICDRNNIDVLYDLNPNATDKELYVKKDPFLLSIKSEKYVRDENPFGIYVAPAGFYNPLELAVSNVTALSNINVKMETATTFCFAIVDPYVDKKVFDIVVNLVNNFRVANRDNVVTLFLPYEKFKTLNRTYPYSLRYPLQNEILNYFERQKTEGKNPFPNSPVFFVFAQ